jgi:hypothetical protein
MAENAVLDLIPLAGSGWEVTHRNFELCLIRQFLQLNFPQPQAVAVTDARIGGDQQATRLGVQHVAHAPPPAADGFDRESRRIMVDSNTDYAWF